MKPNAVDAIFATNLRYSPATDVCRPSYIEACRVLEMDAKLNAAKAIVAEQLIEALQIARQRVGDLDNVSGMHPSVFTLGETDRRRPHRMARAYFLGVFGVSGVANAFVIGAGAGGRCFT